MSAWSRGRPGEASNDAFERAFAHVLRWEGSAYTNDPRDPGGETKFGISRRYHPQVDVRHLDLAGAKTIYLNEYWIPVHGDLIAAKHPGLAMTVFDTAVNIGVHRAIEFLQQALKVKIDGHLGPRTQAAIATCVPEEVIGDLLTHRAVYYFSRVQKDPEKNYFLRGWTARCIFTAMEAV